MKWLIVLCLFQALAGSPAQAEFGFAELQYAPLEIPIPNRYGLSLGWIESPDTSWEVQYTRSSLSLPFLAQEIGEMADQRWTVRRQSFFGNFYFAYGLAFMQTTAFLGSDLLSRTSRGRIPTMDLLEVQGWGAHVAIGHRWQISPRLIVGVEYFGLTQPFSLDSKKATYLNYATEWADRRKVNDALNLLIHFPRITLLNLQIGFSF